MDIGAAITILGAAADLVEIGVAIKDWLFSSLSNPSKVEAINKALELLPKDAKPNEIIAALEPIFIAKGGAVFLTAGDNGGGDLHIRNSVIEGGSGPGGGGGVKISGGNGGPLGKGGVTVISSTTVKGGNAK